MEAFIEEMKRYLGFTQDDIDLLHQLAPRLEKYIPEMSERFYSQIPHHPSAFRVFTTESQIDRLKQTLQTWARELFTGDYDQAYANARFQIGYRHVRIGLEQKFVISAMGIVRAFLNECLIQEFQDVIDRARYTVALNKALDLDLNLMCESYMHATTQGLSSASEQLERANKELAEASHAKDEFLAHISHELRTPLNSIMGFTKLILDGLCDTPEEEHQLLQDAFGSSQHLLGLVNDMLDIGRIEADKLRMHIESVNLRHLLDTTLPLVSMQASDKKLLLRDETSSIELPAIRADEARLRQVLLNILTNAVKFTNSGTITLRAKLPADIGGAAVQHAGQWLRLEVEDTGMGVPPEKRELVFEKFFQVNPAQSKRLGGVGLGLAISRRLIGLMGGSIGMEAGRAGGTLVWLTLPLAGQLTLPSSAAAKHEPFRIITG